MTVADHTARRPFATGVAIAENRGQTGAIVGILQACTPSSASIRAFLTRRLASARAARGELRSGVTNVGGAAPISRATSR